jgi:hypothetical protein
MRAHYGILLMLALFAIWALISWVWYACGIKDACERTDFEITPVSLRM